MNKFLWIAMSLSLYGFYWLGRIVEGKHNKPASIDKGCDDEFQMESVGSVFGKIHHLYFISSNCDFYSMETTPFIIKKETKEKVQPFRREKIVK